MFSGSCPIDSAKAWPADLAPTPRRWAPLQAGRGPGQEQTRRVPDPVHRGDGEARAQGDLRVPGAGGRNLQVTPVLTSSGDRAPEMQTNAQATYGSGTTPHRRRGTAQQFNEQVPVPGVPKQVGPNSGAPMLGFLEKALALTTARLAGVTGSQAVPDRQSHAALLSRRPGGVGMKLLSGAGRSRCIGEMTGMIGSQRLGRGMHFTAATERRWPSAAASGWRPGRSPDSRDEHAGHGRAGAVLPTQGCSPAPAPPRSSSVVAPRR